MSGIGSKLKYKLERQGWREETEILLRGISGGFLFGIPLIYTMEVWWIGSYTEPPMKLALLAVTFGVIFYLNRTTLSGEDMKEGGWETCTKSLKYLAIGILCTTFTLVLLQEVTVGTSLSEALGKIIYEAMPFSFGVALSKLILGQDEDESPSQTSDTDKGQNSDSQGKEDLDGEDLYSATLTDIGGTFIGAFFIAFSIAPTDEVPMLASATSPPFLLAILAASLFISYTIVFASGFTSQAKRHQQKGLFQNPIDETVMSYIVSLFASVLMLVFFQRLHMGDPWTWWLQQAIVLGLPATVGGAAGRLAV